MSQLEQPLSFRSFFVQSAFGSLVHLHVRPIVGVGAPLKHNHRVDTTPNVGADMRGAGIQGSSLREIFEKSLYGLMGADA